MAAGAPFTFDVAKLSGFNLKGGMQVIPELAALVFGLVTFTSAFIAEIVRAGVQAVPHGQTRGGRRARAASRTGEPGWSSSRRPCALSSRR